MNESKDENADGDFNNDTKRQSWSDEDEDERLDYVVKKILKKLNDYSSLSWREDETGSQSTNTEEPHNYDYDYLLCPTKVECRIEPSSLNPCYCCVFVTNKDVLPPEFQAILGPDGELSPSKYKEFVFVKLDGIMKGCRRLVRMQNKSISPAYTVRQCADVGKPVDIDLVPCLKVQNPPEFYMKWKTRKLTEEEKVSCPVYVVPKKYAANDEELDLWRVSFSTFERKILRDKCDNFERVVIQVIKHMLISAGKDEDGKLCSYHITTNCLHFFEKTPSMSEHQYPGDLGEYQLLALESMICALQSKNIPHFFLPTINLLQDVDAIVCQRFTQKLKDYKEYMKAKIEGRTPPREIHHSGHHH